MFSSDAYPVCGDVGCGMNHCGSSLSGIQYPRIGIYLQRSYSILVAVAVWGPQWGGSTVLCHCDNQAMVSVIRSRSCRNKKLMHLLRCLFFFEAYFGIRLQASHIAGVNNGLLMLCRVTICHCSFLCFRRLQSARLLCRGN